MGLCDNSKDKKSTNRNESLKIRIDGRELVFNDQTIENAKICHLAVEAYEKKDYSRALEMFSSIIKADPSAHQFYQFRGTVYEDMGEDDKAKHDFEQSIKLLPTNGTSLFRLGMLYYRQKDLNNAIHYLMLALKHTVFLEDDPFGDSYNNIYLVHRRIVASNLAGFLIQADRADEAIPLLDEVLENCPDYSFAYFNKAMALKQLGRIIEAISFAQTAKDLGHPLSDKLLAELMREKTQLNPNDEYVNMIINSDNNPFNISAEIFNESPLQDYTEVFRTEIDNALNNPQVMRDFEGNRRGVVIQYTYEIVKSFYDNHGVVPQNDFDQALRMIYNALQRSHHYDIFDNFESMKSFMYKVFLH